MKKVTKEICHKVAAVKQSRDSTLHYKWQKSALLALRENTELVFTPTNLPLDFIRTPSKHLSSQNVAQAVFESVIPNISISYNELFISATISINISMCRAVPWQVNVCGDTACLGSRCGRLIVAPLTTRQRKSGTADQGKKRYVP